MAAGKLGGEALASTKAMRIHGKWYDMRGFDHPGGPIMLSLGQGRDATALFEVHHPFTSRPKLEAILAKYETKEPCRLLDERDTGEEFEWPEVEQKDGGARTEAPISDFAFEVRQKVRAYFQAEAKRRGVSLLAATKATPARWLELGILFAIFVATLPGCFRGDLLALVAMSITYWVLGVNLLHDGSHFGLAQDWRINALGTYWGWYFSSPLEWYHQHVIGHHVYANIPNKDPDLYHNASMERHTKTLRWRPMHAHQAFTWAPIWIIGTYAMSFIKPVQMFLTGEYNRSLKMMELSPSRVTIHWAGRVITWLLCYALPFVIFPTWKAFLFATLPVTITSVSFMLSSQVNHLTPANVDQYDSDFYKHQVMTSHTIAHNSYATFLFTGGLNYQIEHHLFPTVNHCHHRHIQPIVKAVCDKYSVPYNYTPTLYGAFRKYLDHLVELGVKPQAAQKAE
ncbi:uncharacterized protein MONBRDRAFT_8218 [Monosiga brevicollis MX1]|uniref:Fatty acid desaturase domain-containing protein n=1 Tax=Monosiga brevicollis TaxID=81824 RepID=A9UZE4_MONBE|nr:uncharacterized protein MONBRDRAFT_8218 [Monosiga brevicollis MX1]EDQ89353.1 predicted protein [Monosiga brevicollis MX1]|eukprot:XP_001745929.1 hypothetical protein [Monosiga brevicollis MX1]